MNIRELLETIEKRPQMFIGELNFDYLSSYIEGFLFNNFLNKRDDFFDNQYRNEFYEWIRIKLGIGDEYKNQNCYIYIKQKYNAQEERIKHFFELSKEFFNEIDSSKN